MQTETIEAEEVSERAALMRLVAARGSLPALAKTDDRTPEEMRAITPYERVLYAVENALSVVLTERNTIETEDVLEIHATWKPQSR